MNFRNWFATLTILLTLLIQPAGAKKKELKPANVQQLIQDTKKLEATPFTKEWIIKQTNLYYQLLNGSPPINSLPNRMIALTRNNKIHLADSHFTIARTTTTTDDGLVITLWSVTAQLEIQNKVIFAIVKQNCCGEDPEPLLSQLIASAVKEAQAKIVIWQNEKDTPPQPTLPLSPQPIA